MKSYRWWAMAMVAATAGGCGSDGPGGGNPSQPVTLTLLRHDNPAYGVADGEFIEQYSKAKPHVTVTPTTLRYTNLAQTLLADLKAGTLQYDIVRVQPSWVCTFADQIADVPADVVTLSEAQNTFFAAPLAGSTCGGKLKGLPVEYNLEYGGVVVNLTKYQAKFGAGKRPAWNTFDDLINEASMLTEYDNGVPKANGLDIAMEWPQPVKHILFSKILQKGGTYWAADGTFNLNTPQARESLTEMVSWVTEKKVMHTSLIPGENTFVTTRLAAGATGFGWSDPLKPLSIMGYVGTWGIPSVKGQVPAQNSATVYEYFIHPPMHGTEHKFVQNSGWSFVVPKNSKNQKAAFEFLKALALTPEAMRKWSAITGSLPALKANGTPQVAAGDPTLAKVQPLLEKGQWVGYIPGGAIETVEGALMSNYFAVVKGMKTVEVALADMQKSANDALAANK